MLKTFRKASWGCRREGQWLACAALYHNPGVSGRRNADEMADRSVVECGQPLSGTKVDLVAETSMGVPA